MSCWNVALGPWKKVLQTLSLKPYTLNPARCTFNSLQPKELEDAFGPALWPEMGALVVSAPRQKR